YCEIQQEFPTATTGGLVSPSSHSLPPFFFLSPLPPTYSSSYFQALLFGGAWAGLIYYCCHDIYEGYVTRRLGTDMADIQANYLQSPDSGFWVAEADVNGQTKVVGMVAVAGRKSEEESARGAGDGGHGEMPHKALDFCKEHGYARLVLDVSSPQTAAISLCQKSGFVQTASHSDTHANQKRH
uniref:N-acetyltransferase domain-containing protein n=1 Tax=Scophthalmus maximus TaxID=52904 RepID=A0A8D3D4G6_SCOMX